MRKLEWYFELVDRVTGPARTVEASLGRVEGALRRLGVAGHVVPGILGRSIAGLRSAVSLAADAFLSAFGRVQAATRWAFSLPGLLAAGAAGMTARFVLGALAFRESALAGLEVVLGTRRAALALMQEAIRFAAATPFETRQVMEMFQDLAMAGFRAREIRALAAAVGDLAAMRGFDPLIIQRVLLAIRQIAAAGVLRGQELRQLTEAGVPLNAVLEQLARVYGRNTTQIQKMQEEGLIPARVGLYALLRAIQETVNRGQALGTFMQRQSQTLTGLWSTLRSRPFELLLTLDVETDPGVQALKRTLRNLADMLDPQSEVGRRVAERVRRWVSGTLRAVFEPLARATEPDRAMAVVDLLLGRLDRLVQWWQERGPTLLRDLQDVWSGFLVGVRVLGMLSRAILAVVNAMDELSERLGVRGLGAKLAGLAALNWLLGGLPFRLLRGGGRLLGRLVGPAAARAAPVLARGAAALAPRAALAVAGPAAAVAGTAAALPWLQEQVARRTGLPVLPRWLGLLGPGALLGGTALAFWQKLVSGPRTRAPVVQRQTNQHSVTLNVNAPITVQGATDPKEVAREIQRVLPAMLGATLDDLALQAGAVPVRASGRRVVAR